ncbi:MAG: protein-S-isoprenylcysteine O-methyltransferase Ste14 [Marinoscillum sp.]|jgi:protein-S-isoprenylcysteine O-methyltransferase Ste14
MVSIMKNENEKIDPLIKEALSEEEAKYYTELNEQNFIVQHGQLFKGKQGWFTAITTIMIFALLGVVIYGFIQFVAAEETKDQILYAVIILMATTSIGLLKIWNWMQMDKYSILREMKRMELQMAALAAKSNK